MLKTPAYTLQVTLFWYCCQLDHVLICYTVQFLCKLRYTVSSTIFAAVFARTQRRKRNAHNVPRNRKSPVSHEPWWCHASQSTPHWLLTLLTLLCEEWRDMVTTLPTYCFHVALNTPSRNCACTEHRCYLAEWENGARLIVTQKQTEKSVEAQQSRRAEAERLPLCDWRLAVSAGATRCKREV